MQSVDLKLQLFWQVSKVVQPLINEVENFDFQGYQNQRVQSRVQSNKA